MNLSREQAISEHRKMWNWIADMTEKSKLKVSKYDYFIGNDMRTDMYGLYNNCYCCEYCYINSGMINFGVLNCDICPIEWGSICKNNMCENRYMYGDLNGYYAQWKRVYDWKEAARLARIIANLPEREVSD